MRAVPCSIVFYLLHLLSEVSSNRMKLLPLSMQKKLCEKDPSLKICTQPQKFGLKNLDSLKTEKFSEWEICDVRPDLGFCNQRMQSTSTTIAPITRIQSTTIFTTETDVEGSGELTQSELPEEQQNSLIYVSADVQPLDL